MPRSAVRPRLSAVTVRKAGPDDSAALTPIVREIEGARGNARAHRAQTASGKRSPHGSGTATARADIELRLGEALASSDHHVLMASLDDETAGVVWCRIGPLDELGSDRVVHVEQFHVQSSWRRRGVGRALLHAVSHLAETHGATAVTMWTGPQDRAVNRYFARAGFVPLAVRRMAPVGALRRALTPSPEAAGPFARAGALRRARRTAV